MERRRLNMPAYIKGAAISDCKRYRYLLERHWYEGDGAVGFIMLNPSTADAYEDDATIRRCIGFAKRWGYSSLYVVNLMAFRATKPSDIPNDELIARGPNRNFYLKCFADSCDLVICAWGASLPKIVDRTFIRRVVQLATGKPYYAVHHCLGVTKNGQPKHPVRLAKDTAIFNLTI